MSAAEQSPETVAVDLRADGVLWAINRITLMGDGTETWQYAAPVDEDQHFADFEALLQKARDLTSRARW